MTHRPPRLALTILTRLRSGRVSSSLVGDLVEEFQHHVVPERGMFRARLWFWLQTLNVAMTRAGRLPAPASHSSKHANTPEPMKAFLRDIRQATRGLLRTPGFTIVAVATLALGIGSNTAVYTVVRGVILSPLPYADADRLVTIGGFIPGVGTQDLSGSPAELRDYQERAASFTGVTAAWPLHTNLVGGDVPVRISTVLTDPGFFDVMGVYPSMGRAYSADDMRLGVGNSAVISWSAWQRYFGGDEDIIGRMINIDGDPVEIVGVMPRAFHHPGQPLGSEIDMWTAMDLQPGGRWFFRDFRPLQLIARLSGGATIESSRAELATIADALRAEYPQSYPDGSGWLTGVEPLRSEVVGGMEQVLIILFGAVGFVLLVACANVSALLITRGAARSRQTAVRMALGGSRGAIARFQLAESLVLSIVGGVVSLIVALATVGVLRNFAAQYMPRADLITFDPSIMVFGLLVAAGTGLIFGMAPAVLASLTNPLALLNDGARGSTGSGSRLRDVLVVGEVAVSVVLVVASGLLIRSFDKLMSVDMGFDPTDIKVVQTYLPVQIDPTEGVYRSRPNRIGFYSEVLRRLEERPDVRAAAGISHLPLRETNGVRFVVEGQDLEANARPSVEYRIISPTYFDVMGIPIKQGRAFTTLDNTEVSIVAMVNEAWVARHADGRDPLTMRVRLGNGNQAPFFQIVGVVGDVRQQSLDVTARETIYAPYLQVAGHDMTFVIESDAEAGGVLDRARLIVQAVDPDQPAFGMAQMEEVVAESVAERKVLVWMVSLFGVLALSLAGLGVFGVVSFRVRQRSREIGIRMALGAKPGSVLQLVLRDGLRLGAIGAGVGVIGALFATRALESMLFGVDRFDPLVLIGVALMTLAVAGAGALLPARKAAAVDPFEILRADG